MDKEQCAWTSMSILKQEKKEEKRKCKQKEEVRYTKTHTYTRTHTHTHTPSLFLKHRKHTSNYMARAVVIWITHIEHKEGTTGWRWGWRSLRLCIALANAMN